jgi:hypothetical protein
MRAPACLSRFGGSHALGEKQNQPFQLSFNASLKVDFQGSRVTSDGGLILVRELGERLGRERSKRKSQLKSFLPTKCLHRLTAVAEAVASAAWFCRT